MLSKGETQQIELSGFSFNHYLEQMLGRGLSPPELLLLALCAMLSEIRFLKPET
jgi:hypothetical protein